MNDETVELRLLIVRKFKHPTKRTLSPKEPLMRTLFLLAILSACVFPTVAQGHFVWLDVVENDGSGAQVEVYFSETVDPGEPHLIAKIANTKLLATTSDDDAVQTIKVKEVRDELTGKLVGPAPNGNSYRIDAVCDYGVVEKGGPAFLLQYYAKYLQGRPTSPDLPASGSNRKPLDAQLAVTPAGFTCTVVWNGQPLANAEVAIQFPGGDSIERQTNDRGQVEVATKTKGKFALLAKHVEAGKAGEHNGKKYTEIRHYATVTWALPGGDAASATTESQTAADLLRSARKARAVWDDFPGFSADLAVRYNDETATGKVAITADGDVVVRMPGFPASDWLQTYLASVVQHRMPGDPENENVRFVEERGRHPLGRKIALGDGDQDSVYRIADDVVREVNRKTGRGGFTISVLEVDHNPEGKYLPLVYTMTFRNADGKVESTHTTQDTWIRVGRFDLPLRTLQVTATDEGRDVKLLEFSNHALEKPAKTGE